MPARKRYTAIFERGKLLRIEDIIAPGNIHHIMPMQRYFTKLLRANDNSHAFTCHRLGTVLDWIPFVQ